MEDKRFEKLERDVKYLIGKVKKLSEMNQILEEKIRALQGNDSDLEEGIQKELSQVYNSQPNPTVNFLRKAIIDDAKQFVKMYSNGLHTLDGYGIITYKVDFKVKKNKRTVEVLLINEGSNYVHKRLTVKCHPNEIFNEHIGKAIALGRALEVDVSEFVDAVQPNSPEKGMIIASKENDLHNWKIESVHGGDLDLIIVESSLKDSIGDETDGHYSKEDTWLIILDDTDAEYDFN